MYRSNFFFLLHPKLQTPFIVLTTIVILNTLVWTLVTRIQACFKCNKKVLRSTISVQYNKGWIYDCISWALLSLRSAFSSVSHRGSLRVNGYKLFSSVWVRADITVHCPPCPTLYSNWALISCQALRCGFPDSHAHGKRVAAPLVTEPLVTSNSLRTHYWTGFEELSCVCMSRLVCCGVDSLHIFVNHTLTLIGPLTIAYLTHILTSLFTTDY